MRLISLDVETSGLDPKENDVLSIGAVDLQTRQDFYAQIKWDRPVLCTGQAMRINGLALDYGMRAMEAMEGLIKFLPQDDDLRIIGMNPRFDREFMLECWKKTIGEPAKFPFHYRTVDLNSVFTFIDQVRSLANGEARQCISQEADSLTVTLHHDLYKHHALYDAWFNVFAWEESDKFFRMIS